MDAAIIYQYSMYALVVAGIVWMVRSARKAQAAKDANLVACKQCGGDMKRHRYSEGNYKIVIGLLVVILGVILVFTVPVFGWIVGLILVLVGFGMGGKRYSGWKCQQCDYFFETK